MISSTRRDIGMFTLIILAIIALVITINHIDKILFLIGNNKGDTRIIQEIAIKSHNLGKYKITTQLQHFNKQWHTAYAWSKYVPGEKIIRTKRLQQSLAGALQQRLEKDLKRFYNQP